MMFGSRPSSARVADSSGGEAHLLPVTSTSAAAAAAAVAAAAQWSDGCESHHSNAATVVEEEETGEDGEHILAGATLTETEMQSPPLHDAGADEEEAARLTMLRQQHQLADASALAAEIHAPRARTADRSKRALLPQRPMSNGSTVEMASVMPAEHTVPSGAAPAPISFTYPSSEESMHAAMWNSDEHVPGQAASAEPAEANAVTAPSVPLNADATSSAPSSHMPSPASATFADQPPLPSAAWEALPARSDELSASTAAASPAPSPPSAAVNVSTASGSTTAQPTLATARSPALRPSVLSMGKSQRRIVNNSGTARVNKPFLMALAPHEMAAPPQELHGRGINGGSAGGLFIANQLAMQRADSFDHSHDTAGRLSLIHI